MPFLTSLIYTGTRVGGQRERAHQAFEAGAAYFPRDFPTSPAYEEFAAARAIADEERWKRKPPAKRVNWDKLSTLDPWASAWRVALGLGPTLSTDTGTDDGSDADLVSTQRDDRPPASAASDSAIRPWLLHGPSARAIVENIARLLGPAPGLLSEMNALRRKRELPPLDAVDADADADALLRGALVHVRVTLCGRGAPDDMAFVYALEDQEARAWVKAHGGALGGAVGYEVGEEPPDASEVSGSADYNSQDMIISLLTFFCGSYRKFPQLTVLSLASSRAATFRCPAAKGMPLARYLWSSSSRRGNRLTGKLFDSRLSTVPPIYVLCIQVRASK